MITLIIDKNGNPTIVKEKLKREGDMKNIVILTTAFIMSACATTKITPATANIIALCNAGIGDFGTAEFAIALDKILSGTGTATSAASSEMKGAFLNGPAVTSDNADALYAKYLGCVDKLAPNGIFQKLPDGSQIAQSIININGNNHIGGSVSATTTIGNK